MAAPSVTSSESEDSEQDYDTDTPQEPVSTTKNSLLQIVDNQRLLHLQEQDVLQRAVREHLENRPANTQNSYDFRQEYFMVC